MINYISRSKRNILIFIGILLMCLLFIPMNKYKNLQGISFSLFIPESSDGQLEVGFHNSNYLVATSKCKILNIDPFNPSVIKFFRPQSYSPCTKLKLLTYVKKIDNIASLHIDTEIISSYTKDGITCCYSNITRRASTYKPDNSIEISTCTFFKDNVTLHHDSIKVICNSSKTKEKVYENVHAVITIKENVKMKMKMLNNKINPFSVLFVGIDSVSRMNVIRSLPITYKFLEDNNWISLKGYNKVDINTFPNVMAILSGHNDNYIFDICNPKLLNKLDECPFIWNEFKKFNYITGYAEDEASIGTFNYLKHGFTTPPTDYYFRPYILASEKLKLVKQSGMYYCTGPETSGERIMNIAKDFVKTFKDHPSFSYFWMNSFSHNELNSVSQMDEKMKEFLEDIANSGTLHNTIVFFLSDHGFRFGEFPKTPVGWLEDRLPFMFILIPKNFQKRYPKEYRNLVNKQHQLTTPYDIYMTLQHILVLSGFNYTIKQSTACPSCKSLFFKTNPDRSCKEAAIEPKWCTCADYSAVNTSQYMNGE